jgi:bifunctional N-acetylglucosamine-1-phosphate-uridyltransferase/glucosamine-1-phosphate-acetyltransferase GlmU-like protein
MLSEAEKALQQRINRYHMENGVTIIDPSSMIAIDTLLQSLFSFT